MSNVEPLDFSTLLASSVHDMKNSIGMLLHLVAQMEAQADGESQQFGQLNFEINRLNNYLIQMMTLYKLEQRQYRSELVEHYLDDFIEDLVLMNRPLLESRGVEVEQQVNEQLSWEFDGQLVNGVISTILTNVIRYAEGRVLISAERVRISADCIQLSANEEGASYLCIRVEDDGKGFPEKMLGKLDLVPMGVDFVSGSTGFGLYFAQTVAQLHRRIQSPDQPDSALQGFVELSNDSSLGGGCFRLFLP
ncbi:sensor histidine kinase KdpD [Motiliproteus sp. MSK22-1]|uniref:sensor histidine kinase n=1 Tax=Motiliproteus sp. MSK22-1 TaxID=1897630 RepID=UPI000975FFF7|nr:HAMP domain-containing sensor histidine kinase [Motiliproteus sp. MSK22-1]OMH38332.1 hypothetical protein BGP75_08820 [Motiliproteus sp. MSK22-1]